MNELFHSLLRRACQDLVGIALVINDNKRCRQTSVMSWQ